MKFQKGNKPASTTCGVEVSMLKYDMVQITFQSHLSHPMKGIIKLLETNKAANWSSIGKHLFLSKSAYEHLLKDLDVLAVLLEQSKILLSNSGIQPVNKAD